MEIRNNQNIGTNIGINASLRKDNEPQVKTPAFRGFTDTVLNKSGAAMNKIENGGFLALFLIQDFLGMTVPRTIAGFLRDKEVTGEYNVQEGFEVLGREGLTGPLMMTVAPLSLWAASKFAGQSTSINSELIKKYGNSLKEMVSEPNFDKELLKNPAEFKEKFYRKNIENILKNAGVQDSELAKQTEYVLEQLRNYENTPLKKSELPNKFCTKERPKSNYRAECLNNITSRINDIKYTTSSDLNMLQKVKLGTEKNAKVFNTKAAFEALVKYSNDAITANKHLEKLDSLMAESIKHNALGKRLLINVGMVAATLGLLSVLPKIYLRGKTSPGSKAKQMLKNDKQSETKKENNADTEIKEIAFEGKKNNNPQDTGIDKSQEVSHQLSEKNTTNNENEKSITNVSDGTSFKGRDKGLIEKLGKIADKNKNEFISSELEYNGHNFTNTLMAGLSVFGLITPRCMRAYSRADVDKNGKKDMTELWEIILRDITSSLAVVFAVPMLTRAFVTSYEKHQGFVLMQKDRTKSGFKTALDLLNPYSKAHVLSNAEISALYDNVNSKEKMINFCKYIDKNGGDLRKILSKADFSKEIFNEKTELLDDLKKLPKDQSNKQITEFMQNIEVQAKKLGIATDKKSIDGLVSKLMKGVSKGGGSKITALARGLVSVPGLLTTFFISPYILGWCIPRLTYKNTRRIHAKQEQQELQEQKEQQLKVKV